MLVTHTKDGTPLVRRASRSSCSSEKQLLGLILIAFGFMCFGGLYFIPESLDVKPAHNHGGHHHAQDHFGVFVEEEPLAAVVKREAPQDDNLRQQELAMQQQRDAQAQEQARLNALQRQLEDQRHQIEQQQRELARNAVVNQAVPPPPVAAGGSKFRADGRCGPRFGAPGAPAFGECDPSADADQKGPCCNPTSGYCGNVRHVDWGHCDCPECVDYSVPADQRHAPRHNFPVHHGVAEEDIPAPPVEVDEPSGPGRRFIGPPAEVVGPPKEQSFESPQSIERKNFIKQMMKTAWDGYRKHAWGHNELMPKARRGHSAGIFGKTQMGATIVDALDTLYIMGMHDEFKEARDWIAQHLSFDVGAGVSVFEVCIRFLAGLLSGYAFTGDEMFKQKALDIGRRLLPAFNTRTGIPKAMVNLKTGASRNWGWASGGCSILSEFGTMQLEFEYLSQITGQPIFARKVAHVMKQTIEKPKPANGMYPNYLHPDKGNWGASDVSIGALGDSFYEYLLKFWVFQGGRDGTPVPHFGREAFDDIMLVMKEKLFRRSQPSNLLYIAEGKGNSLLHKMGHLACFAGGMLALAAKGAPTVEQQHWYEESSKDITHTCHEGYHRSPTHLGPEAMLFDHANEATTSRAGDRYYILRPEVIEAYFYLWRTTHDQKYRDWAWEAAQAIEQHCRCGEGYCGLKDVNHNPPVQDDVQQSFFLAETLKYLYLIFSEDNVIDLDTWVFNTEAHPVPIRHQE